MRKVCCGRRREALSAVCHTGMLRTDCREHDAKFHCVLDVYERKISGIAISEAFRYKIENFENPMRVCTDCIIACYQPISYDVR